MAEIPHAVLSEHFQERMQGRRLCAAVFLTFQFDPGFFEQEILPVFLDLPVSHATGIRLVQLEDALHPLAGQIAVYYDAHGLCVGEAGSAKLDISRIKVHHKTGIFHPKNVFLLVEDDTEDGQVPAKTLLVASLSANLTRAGWWENVEVCHVEEIQEGAKTRLKEDLSYLLDSLRRKAPASEHAALRDIREFLNSTEQRGKKANAGALYPHFYSGRQSLVDFLDEVAGPRLHGTMLEIISPYFDDAVECAPLQQLIDRFQPRDVRVFLPRGRSGEALCRAELYESIQSQKRVAWGRMIGNLSLGSSQDAGERFVHAKVYRFFTQSPKWELYFIGSTNLTSPAHQHGGNVETGFLVESIPLRRPDYWLIPETTPPKSFQPVTEAESQLSSRGTRLNLRYHWDQESAEVFWDGPNHSPDLKIEARGVSIGSIDTLPPKAWVSLSRELSERIRDSLSETSLFSVFGEGDQPAWLLVQEEGMWNKPPLLFQLSVTDMLRYWSLLTPAQRSAFLEVRAPEIMLTGQGADLVAKTRALSEEETLFDRFAGFFHAFSCLERAIVQSLDADRPKEANYRLFGQKYDSLGSCLNRLELESSQLDLVDRYLIILCAKQLCQVIAKKYPDYWRDHASEAKTLTDRFTEVSHLRDQLLSTGDEELEAFLTWFERWFLQRAKPVEAES